MAETTLDKESFELIQKIIKEVKEVRADTNLIAKFTKEQFDKLQQEISNLHDDINAIEQEGLSFAKGLDEANSTLNKKNIGEQSQYINALISDDNKERENRLIESVEALLQKAFSGKKKKK